MSQFAQHRYDLKQFAWLSSLLALVVVVKLLCFSNEVTAAARDEWIFEHPEPVTIRGYSGDAMDPFLTRDGQYLLFNDLNVPSVSTDLHYARRIDDVTFEYQGEIEGTNTPAHEASPTIDRNNVLYFVSTRSYGQTLSTIYRGHFSNGHVAGVQLVPGVSRERSGIVNFDVEVNADGDTLYLVDSQIVGGVRQSAEIVIAVRHETGFERLYDSSRIMEKVNSDALQYAPCVSSDGLTLFFTRAQRGMRDAAIYMATRRDASLPFGRPTRLTGLDGFVEAPALSSDERSLYYHKNEGGRFVIYRATRR